MPQGLQDARRSRGVQSLVTHRQDSLTPALAVVDTKNTHHCSPASPLAVLPYLVLG
jgi:hypothetical protein